MFSIIKVDEQQLKLNVRNYSCSQKNLIKSQIPLKSTHLWLFEYELNHFIQNSVTKHFNII